MGWSHKKFCSGTSDHRAFFSIYILVLLLLFLLLQKVLVPEDQGEFGADVWVKIVKATKFAVFGEVLTERDQSVHAVPVDTVLTAPKSNASSTDDSVDDNSTAKKVSSSSSLHLPLPLLGLALLLAFLALRFGIATLKSA